MKTLVVEDSRLAREGLVRMLREYPQLDVVGAAEDARRARGLIHEHRPALLFLDIHLPGESGFELLESLDYQPKIIFTTAYSDYAIKSFDYHTVDYLLKPVSRERLETALQKIRSPAPVESGGTVLAPENRVFIKDGAQCHLIEIATIDYIESCKNYVRVFFGGRRAFVKQPLGRVEQRLPADVFFRASRQFLVNLHAVDSIDESIGGGYQLTMTDGRLIDVSRRNAARFKDFFSF